MLPLLLLVLLAFAVPLAVTLGTALRDPELSAALPRTAALLRQWDGAGLPGPAVFAAIATELAAADRDQSIGALTRRLNFEQPGMRALLLRTARAGVAPDAMVRLDARWGEPGTWRLIRRAAGPWTDVYVLRALDLARDGEDRIVRVPDDQAVFIRLLRRTLGIGLTATALCVLLGYPVAYALTTLRGGLARLALALVVLPFWTSVLVRTTAWFILLQRQGPVNALLVGAGVLDQPAQLIFTRFAVLLAMVHVLLPFAVLPMYGVMRRLDPALMRAAGALGAAPWQAFLRVYLPLSAPGVAAAAVLVFLLAVGYWVTPALVGGATDQMVGNSIAAYTNETLNWGMAAALASLLMLLSAVAVLLARLIPGVRLAGWVR